MNAKELSFEDSVAKSVVETGKCWGCGACVLTCPYRCLELSLEQPVLAKECKACGICAKTCPRYEWSWPDADSFVFGRQRRTDEKFGVYRRLALARASDEKVRRIAQDGGAVTALLLFAMEKRLIDGAVVSGVDRSRLFFPVTRLATSANEVLECAGSRYSYSPNVLALTEVPRLSKASLAFVGTSCQIDAVRRMQMSGLRKHVAQLKLLIGLVCSECFVYEDLVQRKIVGELGLKASEVRKVNIKGELRVTTSSGIKSVPLAELKDFVRKGCLRCDDFSSELADISAGGLGLNGWTFLILRTKEGERLFSEALDAGAVEAREAAEAMKSVDLLNRLSEKKRRSSK